MSFQHYGNHTVLSIPFLAHRESIDAETLYLMPPDKLLQGIHDQERYTTTTLSPALASSIMVGYQCMAMLMPT